MLPDHRTHTTKMIATAALLTSCFKMLLIPAYRSTDFEVHRNWLAITHSLPMNKWYFEDTSEWTLDYPPLFAWFEYMLSHIATFFDAKMLDINNLNYESWSTIIFQRLSVIVADLVYIYGVHRCSSTLPKSWKTEVVLPVLMVTNCGLIMLDHIHFQYNGMLYGILLISIANIMKDHCYRAAFWFCVLINMKHIYIYLAPVYFVYLMRHHCLKDGLQRKNRLPINFLRKLFYLGGIVITVFAVTFLPFYDHLGQVLARMFPFKRGLCHAYWAPNFWAFYNVIDKVAFLTARICGLTLDHQVSASMTGGLVQQYSHSVLPNISPMVTLILTVVFMMPALVKLWTSQKEPLTFLRCVVLCALTSFLFGWHVHEKAILMAIIPLSVAAIMDASDARLFLILSTVGHFSLFPLLFPRSFLLVKALLLILHSTYCFHSLYKIYATSRCRFSLPLINLIETIYLLGLILIFMNENFLHFYLRFDNTLPFLSLMITSFYCSVGIIYCWIVYYIKFLKPTKKGTENMKKLK